MRVGTPMSARVESSAGWARSARVGGAGSHMFFCSRTRTPLTAHLAGIEHRTHDEAVVVDAAHDDAVDASRGQVSGAPSAGASTPASLSAGPTVTCRATSTESPTLSRSWPSVSRLQRIAGAVGGAVQVELQHPGQQRALPCRGQLGVDEDVPGLEGDVRQPDVVGRGDRGDDRCSARCRRSAPRCRPRAAPRWRRRPPPRAPARRRRPGGRTGRQ